MKLGKSVSLQKIWKMRISTIYSIAKITEPTSEVLQKRVLDCLKSLPKGTPNWVKSYLAGVRDALHDRILNHTEFCYWLDGKRYSIRKPSPLYYQKHDIKAQDLSEKSTGKGFYWIAGGNLFWEGEKDTVR